MSDLIEQDGQYMNFTSEPWVILSPIEQSIKAKIEKYGTPLKNWNVNIYRGILTGCNEAFIIDEAKKNELIAKDPNSAQIIRPILRGKDIKRYGYDFKGLYLIATHNGYKDVPRVNIDDYPAIKEWLDNGGIAYNGKEYKGYETIAKRADQGDTPYNLRSCAYMDDFSKPKLLYSEIVQEPHFYLDKNGKFYNEATSFLMTGNHLEYLQIMLHSKLMTFAFKHYYAGGGLGNTGFRYKKAFLEKLPIIHPTKELEQNLIFCSDKETMICKMYNLSNTEITLILQN